MEYVYVTRTSIVAGITADGDRVGKGETSSKSWLSLNFSPYSCSQKTPTGGNSKKVQAQELRMPSHFLMPTFLQVCPRHKTKSKMQERDRSKNPLKAQRPLQHRPSRGRLDWIQNGCGSLDFQTSAFPDWTSLPAPKFCTMTSLHCSTTQFSCLALEKPNCLFRFTCHPCSLQEIMAPTVHLGSDHFRT